MSRHCRWLEAGGGVGQGEEQGEAGRGETEGSQVR